MTLSEFYAAVGSDVAPVLARIPSEKMLVRFVRMYAADPTYDQLLTAVAAEDWPTAFRAAHTLKGVAQNLGFDRLQAASSALTEALRGDRPLTDAALLERVREAREGSAGGADRRPEQSVRLKTPGGRPKRGLGPGKDEINYVY